MKTYILNANETISYEQHSFTGRYLPVARNVNGVPRPFGALPAKSTARTAAEALDCYAKDHGLGEFY